MILISRMTMIIWIFFAFLSAHACSCVYMHKYATGEILFLKVNSLTSIDSLLPYSYYSLPYCKPAGGIRKSSQNIGQSLVGDQVLNSPYRFKMNVNESVFLCTTSPLTKHEAEVLKQRTRELYQVNMMLDSLPVMRYAQMGGVSISWTGFPVGYEVFGAGFFILNHLKFRVLIHEIESEVEIIGVGEEGRGVIYEADTQRASGFVIVGFEVIPSSVKRDPSFMANRHMYDRVAPVTSMPYIDESQIIKEGEQITFTYEVEFVKSNTQWSSRWDAYLKMENTQIHWFSILNSFILILIIAGVMFFKIFRTVRKDLNSHSLDKEGQMNEELPEWMLIEGDVFREPNNFKLLCVMVGSGVQITGMGVATVVFAAVGFISPACQGMLLTAMIMLYLFMGIAAGFVAVRLWRFIKGTSEGWTSVSWSVARFFPGITFAIISIMNFIYFRSRSTAYISISSYAFLLLSWFGISVPLTLLGGFLGTKPNEQQYYVSVNKIPREIPKSRHIVSWLLLLLAGLLPFSTIFIQNFFFLSSLWLGRYYNAFGFLLIVMLLLVIVCGQVSVTRTFSSLRRGNWQWWWRAFLGSGITAVYVYAYGVNYLVYDLKGLSGSDSAVLYLGYSLITAIAFMLSTGAIGFLMSFFFVRSLYKAE